MWHSNITASQHANNICLFDSAKPWKVRLFLPIVNLNMIGKPALAFTYTGALSIHRFHGIDRIMCHMIHLTIRRPFSSPDLLFLWLRWHVLWLILPKIVVVGLSVDNHLIWPLLSILPVLGVLVLSEKEKFMLWMQSYIFKPSQWHWCQGMPISLRQLILIGNRNSTILFLEFYSASIVEALKHSILIMTVKRIRLSFSMCH